MKQHGRKSCGFESVQSDNECLSGTVDDFVQVDVLAFLKTGLRFESGRAVVQHQGASVHPRVKTQLSVLSARPRLGAHVCQDQVWILVMLKQIANNYSPSSQKQQSTAVCASSIFHPFYLGGNVQQTRAPVSCLCCVVSKVHFI